MQLPHHATNTSYLKNFLFCQKYDKTNINHISGYVTMDSGIHENVFLQSRILFTSNHNEQVDWLPTSGI